MMETARTSETSVDIQLRTWQYIPEYSELHCGWVVSTPVSHFEGIQILTQKPAILIQVLCGFPQFLQTNAR
jgi:hypothetical protein